VAEVKKTRKRDRKVSTTGVAHVQASFHEYERFGDLVFADR